MQLCSEKEDQNYFWSKVHLTLLYRITLSHSITDPINQLIIYIYILKSRCPQIEEQHFYATGRKTERERDGWAGMQLDR
jgi:hypothetical protein